MQYTKRKVMNKVFIFFMTCFLTNVALCDYLTGYPRVIDGDTIEVSGEKVRLICIDTPESKYKNKAQLCDDNKTNCGQMATDYLVEMIHISTIFDDADRVICEYTKRDMYGRILGECFGLDYNNRQGKVSYNRQLLEDGYAYYYPCVEHKEWKQIFQDSYDNKIGLFQYGFQEPKQWRKAHK